jgi:hypothetical protein
MAKRCILRHGNVERQPQASTVAWARGTQGVLPTTRPQLSSPQASYLHCYATTSVAYGLPPPLS